VRTFIYFIEEIAESCANLNFFVFGYFLSIAPLVVPLLQGIGHIVSSIKNSERNRNAMFYATDLLRNFGIIMLFIILSGLLSWLGWNEVTHIDFLVRGLQLYGLILLCNLLLMAGLQTRNYYMNMKS